MRVEIEINGVRTAHEVEPRTLLVHYIRDVEGLTGTHVGCDTSNCGACTVHLDGEAVKSCTVLAAQADGHSVTTIEGIADGEEWHPVQQGFHECHGLQCGYCTPGMVMASVALLEENPESHAGRAALRAWLPPPAELLRILAIAATKLRRRPLGRIGLHRTAASAETMLDRDNTRPIRPLISARQADLGDLHWASDSGAGACSGGNTRNAGKSAPCHRHGMRGSGATTLPGLRCSGSGGQPNLPQHAPHAAPLSAPLAVPQDVPPIGLPAPPAAPQAAPEVGQQAVPGRGASIPSRLLSGNHDLAVCANGTLSSRAAYSVPMRKSCAAIRRRAVGERRRAYFWLDTMTSRCAGRELAA